MTVRLDENRSKILFAGIVPLAFLLLLTAASAALVSRIEGAVTVSTASTELLAQSAVLAGSFAAADRALGDYVAGRKAVGLREYDGAVSAIPAQSARLLALVPKSSPNYANALRYASLSHAGLLTLRTYFSYLQRGDVAGAANYARTPTVRKLGSALTAARNTFDQTQRTNTIRLFDQLSQDLRRYAEAILAICVVGVLAAFLVVGGLGQLAQRIHDVVSQRKELLAAYRREHDVASTLQRALLPVTLPTFPGIKIDAAYVPAAKGADIGGDWYDVFTLSENTIALSIGDVEGHDVYAASVMGRVRQAIRITAQEQSDPARVLERVNALLFTEREQRTVSAFLGTFNLLDGNLTYASAGHPPPIIIRPGGRTAQLECSGLMLGVDVGAQFLTHKTNLGQGCGLLLYTDGLIEAERDYIAGMNKLEEILRSDVVSANGNVAELIQRRIFSAVEPRDDSAILFLGVAERADRFEPRQVRAWTVNAKDEVSAHQVKRALLSHLEEVDVSTSDLEAIEAIVGELTSNVARHTPGDAEVILELAEQGIRLSVYDRGEPFDDMGDHAPELLAEAGRGLFIVRALAGNLSVERAREGNCVSVIIPAGLRTSMTAAKAS